jgi:hypothetical protein
LQRQAGPYVSYTFSVYVSDSGERTKSFEGDYLLSKDMATFEIEWKNALGGKPTARFVLSRDTPNFLKGYNDVPSNKPWRHVIVHSPNLLYDFGGALDNEKSHSLARDCKERMQTAWASFSVETRERIWATYCNCFEGFYSRLDQDRKTKFERFAKAYRSVIELNRNPEEEIFKPGNESVHQYYSQHYPWLCTNFPNVPDRAIIFEHEMNEKNGKRINWGRIERLLEGGE